MKSLVMSPPGKGLIPNQDINILGIKNIKVFHHNQLNIVLDILIINEAEDGRNDSTDNSRTDKQNYVNNLKAVNNKNIDDKYKDENSQNHSSN